MATSTTSHILAIWKGAGVIGKQTVRDVDVRDKRVLVRVDFNAPLDGNRITDDTRIRASIPTIRYLLERGAAVILASHLGRPGGKAVPSLSLKPVAERLSTLLGIPVETVPDAVGSQAERAAQELRPGQVLLLENLRFHPQEEDNDAAFARQLAGLADIYVNDAFGSAHRAHASTVGVTAYLPAVSGLLMAKELEELGRVLDHPRRPLAALIGGAKISTKIGVLRNLMDVADEFLIGGGMANTLLKAQGRDVGRSLVENDELDVARDFLGEAERRGRTVYLPADAVVTERVEPGATSRTIPIDQVCGEDRIVDIGPRTVAQFTEVLRQAGTVVWNGPMGVFEIPQFARGTMDLAAVLASAPGDTIVGGGDSVAAVEAAGVADRIGHISTGGGASLEFLEGRDLPGVAALDDARGE